jgi:helix-hairpin-helix protein
MVGPGMDEGPPSSYLLLAKDTPVFGADEVIACLPSLDKDLAEQIVAARERLGGFVSLEDLGTVLDLPGDQVEDLRQHVVFLPR